MKKGPGSGSPEEKLLKIIEGKDTASGGAPKKKAFAFSLKGFSLSGFDLKKIKLKSVNLGFAALALLLTVVFVILFISKKKDFEQRIGLLVAENKKPSAIFFESAEKKPSLDKYMLEVKRNNPFDLIPESTVTKKKETKVSYKLAGIIWSNNPQVIIEDEVSKKTYMVSKGDSLLGGYKVINITQNEVVIRGKDGEQTLR